ADVVLVPVIPTTLSQRTFEQLLHFFKENQLPERKLLGFFSMEQGVKSLHADTIQTMQSTYKRRFLKTRIPFSSAVERMGIERAPVVATAPTSIAAKAYQELGTELIKRLG